MVRRYTQPLDTAVMTEARPKISIVTPSFNQWRFLEATIRSVLDQNYPALEYVVVDGGSTDGSVDILRRHADRLTGWTSEPDHGQYDALNKGFARTSGEIMGWLNSDDLHTPWTLALVAEVFAALPEVEWLTSLHPLGFDERGLPVNCATRGPYSRKEFLRGDYLPGFGWRASGWIQQESTFWRRSLWERAGGCLDSNLRFAADFELWARFFRHASLAVVESPLAGFRHHNAQKTAGDAAGYKREAAEILARHGGKPRGRLGAAWAALVRQATPQRFRSLGGALGLLNLGRVCVYDHAAKSWRIVER